MKYYIEKQLNEDFESAVSRTREVLAEQGFGVISEVDMQAKLKEKLGVEMPGYLILGACNPPLAYTALLKEEKIGILLPCNVIVRDTGDGTTEVAAVDPVTSMEITGNEAISEIAGTVKEKLEMAVNSL